MDAKAQCAFFLGCRKYWCCLLGLCGSITHRGKHLLDPHLLELLLRSGAVRGRMDRLGCALGELDPVYRHFYSAKMAVSGSMKFCKHSDDFILTPWVRGWNLDFILPIAHLLMRVVLLDRCVLRYLRSSAYRWLLVNSRDILGTWIFLHDFARGTYFRSNGIRNCLGCPYKNGVWCIRISCIHGAWRVRWCAVCAVFMFFGKWTSPLEKLLTRKQNGWPSSTLIFSPAASIH